MNDNKNPYWINLYYEELKGNTITGDFDFETEEDALKRRNLNCIDYEYITTIKIWR